MGKIGTLTVSVRGEELIRIRAEMTHLRRAFTALEGGFNTQVESVKGNTWLIIASRVVYAFITPEE